MEKFTITVTTLNNMKQTVEVSPTDNISVIKEQVFKHKGFVFSKEINFTLKSLGYGKDLQRFVFRGKTLRDDKTIKDYGIHEGQSVLRWQMVEEFGLGADLLLLIRLCGGNTKLK